jgi:hypothetical protein
MQTFLASAANLQALDAPNRLDGRDEPGHEYVRVSAFVREVKVHPM